MLVEKRWHPRDTSPRVEKLPASGTVKSARSGDWSFPALDWQPLCLPRPALAETYSCPCRSDSAAQKKLHVPLKARGSFSPGSRERAKWKEQEKTEKRAATTARLLYASHEERFEECALGNDGLTSRREPITSPRLAALLQPVFPAGRSGAV